MRDRDDGVRRAYAPPADDDAPLDIVEQAIVRALVPVILNRIRQQLAAEEAAADADATAPHEAHGRGATL